MKWLLAVVVAFGATAPSYACNSQMLLAREWQASANEGNKFLPVDLTAHVQYAGEKPYRMIHAGVIFSDVLGQSLGQVNLDRDQVVSPMEMVTVDGLVDADKRLLTINRDDVVVRTCVWSIVYDDGTTEEF